MQRTRAWLALAPLLIGAGCGGGGGPSTATAPASQPLKAADLAVLYDDGDPNSEAMARAYQQARGIPAANMVAVTLPARTETISPTQFALMKAAIDAKLPSTVQATLLTWMQPSRVAGNCSMSVSTALALGYDTRYCNASVNSCTTTSASAYYDSASRRPWDDLRIRPSMMLGTATMAEAQALIARGLAAEGNMGTGAVAAHAWLVRTNDPDRSTRFDDFMALANTTVPGVTMHYVDNADGGGSNAVLNQRNVLFYLTGLASVQQPESNSYLPGAVADHLTSFAGYLPDGNGQMPITTWLRAGVTGSYGTVEEPCNYPAKFPRATVLVKYYQQGETLIEAYWKSVQRPGQGLFVGDPLARPWKR